MQARRPVKATVLLSAELSNSVTVITLIVAPQERLTYRVAFFLAGRRARVLGAGAFFCSTSMLARSASIRLTTRGGGVSPAGSILFASLFLLQKVNESVFVAIFELRRIEVTSFRLHNVGSQVE